MPASSSDAPPPKLERKGSSVRSLKRFDTSAFTLHEHCGQHAARVRDCLKNANVAHLDPVALEERGWDIASECKQLWTDYRKCGLGFFSATDWAQSKCAEESKAFQMCNPRVQGAERCNDLELAMAKCATAKIRLRMSGKGPPGM